MTKRKVKRLFIKGEMGLSIALDYLMFDFGMVMGDALKYLGL